MKRIWEQFEKRPGPEVIKLLCSTQLRVKFILLINVEMTF